MSTSAQRLSLPPRAALQWHLAALAIYALLAALLSWPLVADFTTEVPPGDDTRQNIAILWGTREWLAGSGPLFDRPLFYYPYGASLLSSGLGPLIGLFALPFWLFGTSAGHNGAVLVALTLTGYAMFLLARELELEPAVALFCGARSCAPQRLALGTDAGAGPRALGRSNAQACGHTFQPPLPYNAAVALSGLSFMRVPGRFIQWATSGDDRRCVCFGPRSWLVWLRARWCSLGRWAGRVVDL